MTGSEPFPAFLASTAYEIDPIELTAARDVVASGPDAVYRRLVRDRESAAVFALARQVLHGFLGGRQPVGDPGGAGIVEHTGRLRDTLAATVGALPDDPGARRAVLAQRAPLALLDSCWLDTVSQPATQPGPVVNHLVRHRFALLGAGGAAPGRRRARAEAMAHHGVALPDLLAEDFLERAGARDLTTWYGAYRLALATVPATFLPEVVGTHYAMTTLGIDDLLLGTACPIEQDDLDTVLTGYLDAAPEPVRHRVLVAVELAMAIETRHVGSLVELARRQAGLSLDAQVARIIARHAPFAGRQHRSVRVAGRPLIEWFADLDTDLTAFVDAFRDSPMLAPRPGGCAFLRAIRFGGPMFGIFDDREAATFSRWADAVAAGAAPPEPAPDPVEDEEAAKLAAAVAGAVPDAVLRPATRGDDRAFFHRLVHIERFPNTFPLARACAEDGLRRAEILFDHGAGGTLTDASWFDYSAAALRERTERIYWDKLVDPYEPLTTIPPREEVVFNQKTYALGSMIDGAWAHRIGRTGYDTRRSDELLYGIYADEMGRGDPVKNHITLIYQVLASLGIEVPHIGEAAFLDQDELPDHLYGFSLFQLSLVLFAESRYSEILGYNLGIEMYGLGTQRMHEIEKLRHHRFDPAYEAAHLSIDNLSAGHARQSVDIIVAHLHDVERHAGPDAVAGHWRRVWRGYASFAWFVEHRLVGSVAHDDVAELVV